MSTQELQDLLLDIRNHTLIAEILIRVGHEELLPTCLEDMYIHAQEIAEDFCSKEKE